MRMLPLLVAVLLMSCEGDVPTIPPSPPPPPVTEPTPPPLPRWSLITFPLRASGSQFMDAAGRQVWRWGAWDLYGSGWIIPPANKLQRMAEAGVNFVGARPGPQSARGPDGYACEQVLPALEAAVSAAWSYGMAVEVALFDPWVIQHGYSCDPSWKFDDFHGNALTSSQKKWLEALADVLRGNQNVLLLDGNEMFKANPSLAWWQALQTTVRNLFPGTLLGTNSENRQINQKADFVIYHQDAATGIAAGKPTGVNESGPVLICQQWIAESQYARRLGTFFDLWRGDMDDAAWEACLVKHAEIRGLSGK